MAVAAVRVEKTDQFDDDYDGLEDFEQDRVDAALERLAANPGLPGLRFRKLRGRKDPLGRDIWYFRVSDSIRCTCVRLADAIFLRRVGHHDVERKP